MGLVISPFEPFRCSNPLYPDTVDCEEFQALLPPSDNAGGLRTNRVQALAADGFRGRLERASTAVLLLRGRKVPERGRGGVFSCFIGGTPQIVCAYACVLWCGVSRL